MPFASAIIAGGQGRRMGTPHKAALDLGDGTTPAGRLAAVLVAAGCRPPVIIASDPGPYLGLNLPVLSDRRPGEGPLAGIETALLALAPDPVCLVAGDMPRVGVAEVRTLLNAWNGRLVVAWTSRMQPLCALVGSELVSDLSAALDRGERSVFRLWDRLGAASVQFPSEDPFADLDTRDDLNRLFPVLRPPDVGS